MPFSHRLQKDIDAVNRIPMIRSLLDVICRSTNMGFSAVARVTEGHWIACSVQDEIGFGLQPGGELEIKTTICNEIRESRTPVVIDEVSTDPDFCDHHTPAMYGFQSYISVPILLRDGSFFGTLCAIDPHPHKVSSPEVTNMFQLFSQLISFHLDALAEMDASSELLDKQRAFSDELECRILDRTLEIEQKNTALKKMNRELQSFAYISSHDLQEPLRKIQTFASFILEKEAGNLSANGKKYFSRMQEAASRMQHLINDLLAYTRSSPEEPEMAEVDLDLLILEIAGDLDYGEHRIELMPGMGKAVVNPHQFRLLLQNLLGNSVKFTRPGAAPSISVSVAQFGRDQSKPEALDEEKDYWRLRVEDNGIGFDMQYRDKIFELFQRLNSKTDFAGTGIGLAIAKRIVENHHGHITASSEAGQGAVFDVYFPR